MAEIIISFRFYYDFDKFNAFLQFLSSIRSKEKISVDVKTILAEKYPEDRATAFLVRYLRSAISVKFALPP